MGFFKPKQGEEPKVRHGITSVYTGCALMIVGAGVFYGLS